MKAALLRFSLPSRRWLLALGVGAAAIFTAGVAYAASSTSGSSSKQSTNYSWSVTQSNNKVCPSNPSITEVDEQLSGSSGTPPPSDSRETGPNQVHVWGLYDSNGGNGFLDVALSVQSTTDHVNEQALGPVVLGGPSSGPLTVGGALEGLAENANPSYSNPFYGPASSSETAQGAHPVVVTNIEGTATTSSQSNGATEITSISGNMGGQTAPHGNNGVYIECDGYNGNQ